MPFSKVWNNKKAALPEEIRERYDRQIRMPEIGEEGQTNLNDASILIIGAGGLGSSAAFYLSAAGVGHLGIVDNDIVELGNLNRQILHTPETLGIPKTVSARKTLSVFNPNTRIDIYSPRLSKVTQIENLIRHYDIVLDCTDNFETRYLLNLACISLGKPWIYAAVTEFEGQAMVIIPGQTPCFECLYPSLEPSSKAPAPVLGVTPGVMGIIQATEAVKYLLNQGELLTGRLLFADLWDMHFDTMQVSANDRCPACQTDNGS